MWGWERHKGVVEVSSEGCPPANATAAAAGSHCSLVVGAAWALLLKAVLPCCLAYCTELAARRTFCRRVATAAAAARAAR